MDFISIKETSIVSFALEPIWNDFVPNEPSSKFCPPKVVVSEIRVNSSCSAPTSFCIAARSSPELEPFAACNDKSRIRCKIFVDSDIAPSAVCAIEIPSLALRIATFKPLVWLVKRFEICRPAASSLAELMRKPDDSFSMLLATPLLAPFR